MLTPSPAMVTFTQIHGWTNGIAYGILFPIGIGIARNFMSLGPMWLWAHVGCQLLGYVFATIGFVTGWIVGSNKPSVQLHL